MVLLWHEPSILVGYFEMGHAYVRAQCSLYCVRTYVRTYIRMSSILFETSHLYIKSAREREYIDVCVLCMYMTIVKRRTNEPNKVQSTFLVIMKC